MNRLLFEMWVDKAFKGQYELAPIAKGSHLIGKGSMYGQMICFSLSSRVTAAWRSYESDGGDAPFIEYLQDTLP